MKIFNTITCVPIDATIQDIVCIEYYMTSANRIKNRTHQTGVQTCVWAERSPYAMDTQHYCFVTQSGTASAGMASYDLGFAPFGVI